MLDLFRRKDYVGYFQNTGNDSLIEMPHRTFAGATAQYIPEASFCQLNRAAEFRVDETRRPRKLWGFRGLVGCGGWISRH